MGQMCMDEVKSMGRTGHAGQVSDVWLCNMRARKWARWNSCFVAGRR